MDILYCNFCGCSQKEVEVLIQGSNVHVCNECIVLCQEMVDEHRRAKQSPAEQLSAANKAIVDLAWELEKFIAKVDRG